MQRVDVGKTADRIGGYSELARQLGVPTSTCHGWERRRRVPPWRMEALIELAKTNRFRLVYVPVRRKRKVRKPN